MNMEELLRQAEEVDPFGSKLVLVIQTNELVGEGTPESPYRRVIKYYSSKGTLLATHDLLKERKAQP